MKKQQKLPKAEKERALRCKQDYELRTKKETIMAKQRENRLGPAFDKWKSDPGFKKDFDQEYLEFALSELMLALMEHHKKSVRKLAEIVGLSPTAIQDLRSGKAKDVKFKNFLNLLRLVDLVKGDRGFRCIPTHGFNTQTTLASKPSSGRFRTFLFIFAHQQTCYSHKTPVRVSILTDLQMALIL